MTMLRKLAPGAPGTKKYVEKYGDALVCVRYRYNSDTRTKSKTVELLVSEEKWTKKQNYIPPNKRLHLDIPLDNTYLQKLVREAGGYWDRETQRLRLSYRLVKSLGLESKIDWALEKSAY